MKTTTPDLELLEGAVAEPVLQALRATSEQLGRLGVRHWIVGGLAVAAHGYRRNTQDVDFLVGDEAFEHHAGGLITMKPGVPIQANGVVVDHLSATSAENFLTRDLPPAGVTLKVAPIEILAYLKLKSPRSKDRTDLIELIKAGADVARCRAWLLANAPHFVTALDDAERVAHTEE